MNRTIAILLALWGLTWTGCRPEEDPSDEMYREVLLLQVDYQTKRFEGGARYAFPEGGLLQDSIPVRIEYQEPSDIGYFRLVFNPTNTTLFEGSIFYDSVGQRQTPAHLDSPTSFEAAGQAAEIDSGLIKLIDPGLAMSEIPFGEVWAAVANRSLVQSYLDEGALVGIFRYVPTVIGGGPEYNDWYWVLYR